MIRGRSRRWREWRNRNFDLAELLALRSSSGTLPIPLWEVAQKRLVRDVEFRPLLMDGCLAVVDDGFVIYVGCDKSDVDDFSSRLRSEKIGTTPLLPSRIRFTIAHEIAHTFFFDLKAHPPKSAVDSRHHKTIQSLEATCNETASRILLPDSVLTQQVMKSDFLNPEVLRDFGRRAGVSPEALIIRIGRLLHRTHDVGGIACVKWDSGEYRISKIDTHPVLRAIFSNAKEGSSSKALVGDPSFCLNEGKSLEAIADMPCGIGPEKAFQRCAFTVERRIQTSRGRSAEGTYFLTIRRVGQPTKAGVSLDRNL